MEMEHCRTAAELVPENKSASVPVLRWVHWWPWLLGPLTMALVYLADAMNGHWYLSKGLHENIALLLLTVPITAFAIQAIVYRSEFGLFMAVLCVAFFCREWHFAGTSTGIYVALGVLAVWAIIRKRPLEAIIGKGHTNLWLWATFMTYLLSQIIARRVFRYLHLPHEARLHVPLEEAVETTAHILMIVTSIIAWKAVANLRQTARISKSVPD